MNPLSLKDQARIALLGGAFRWQDTPIIETPMARATDPFRQTFRDANWWRAAEPRDPVTGEKLIRLMGGRTLRITDGKAEENRVIHHSNERPAAKVGDELEPGEAESIGDWFGRLATRVDFNGPKKIFVDAMRSYASRFRGDGLAKKLLDAKLVRKFIEQVA